MVINMLPTIMAVFIFCKNWMLEKSEMIIELAIKMPVLHGLFLNF